ncbi:MAG: LysE family transporter [Pseudomonadota bacterium]
MILAFLFGFLFALGLIVPLGPQNMFVLSQGIRKSNRKAIATVVTTVALSDTLLILLAVLGLTLVILKVSWFKDVILIAGIVFLLYLGWQSWRQATELNNDDALVNPSPLKLVLFSLGVSLLNPYAILDTLVTIGSVSLTYHGVNKIAFVTACIMTSWVWFIFLATVGRYLAKLDFFNKHNGHISAIVMWGAAIYLFAHLFF